MHVFLAGADPDRRPVHFVEIAGACTDPISINCAPMHLPSTVT